MGSRGVGSLRPRKYPAQNCDRCAEACSVQLIRLFLTSCNPAELWYSAEPRKLAGRGERNFAPPKINPPDDER
eukprot:1466926-Alexandrium_andersonii.AAC.1